MYKVAVLVDGAFFIKRFRTIYSTLHKNFNFYDAAFMAKEFYTIILKHLNWTDIKNRKTPTYEEYLYRILYYDCPPMSKRAHNPVTNKSIDFSKSDEAKFRLEFHNELRKKRKVALRLGTVKDSGGWIIKPEISKKLLKKEIKIEDLKENDVFYEVRQKGVDMKIGLDIASLSYKKLVDRIILISGDSDFVPAAKVARREGIDFVLDPMWNPIGEDLHEHIDGLQSTIERPKYK